MNITCENSAIVMIGQDPYIDIVTRSPIVPSSQVDHGITRTF